MYYLIMLALGYLLGIAVATSNNNPHEFNCIAAQGEIAIMQWFDGKPHCTVSTKLKEKKGNNLKSWKE